nr:hypothetical protein [Clostridia bacterium]
MKKIIITLIMLIFTVLMTAGCDKQAEPEPSAVVFVLGMHDNFPYQGTLAALRDTVYEACYSYGEVTVVVVDGNSYIGADYDIERPDVNIDNAKRKQMARQSTEAIMQRIVSLKAVTPEVDTLSAVNLAADKLRASECASKTVILADSACSTAGILNFAASRLIEDTPENIVNGLKAIDALPDLTDISVEVIGMGQTSGAQTPLSPYMSKNLIRIWDAILTEAGAAEVDIDTTPLAVYESDADLPYVTPVTVISDTLIYTVPQTTPADESTDPEVQPIMPEVVRFDETAIRFVGNAAAFADEAQAVESVRPIAGLLCANPAKTVYLAGMTASTGGDGIQLSTERAEAVKRLLTDMGCDADRIICVGLGRSQNHLRADDLDDSGNLIESMAKLNRAVFLFEYGSDTAVRLGLE